MKIHNWARLILALAIVAAAGFLLTRRTSAPSDPLPIGYTLENYSVEKITGVQCSKDNDCQTPPEYMAMSRCPFVSLCLKNQCTVVCPATK